MFLAEEILDGAAGGIHEGLLLRHSRQTSLRPRITDRLIKFFSLSPTSLVVTQGVEEGKVFVSDRLVEPGAFTHDRRG